MTHGNTFEILEREQHTASLGAGQYYVKITDGRGQVTYLEEDQVYEIKRMIQERSEKINESTEK